MNVQARIDALEARVTALAAENASLRADMAEVMGVLGIGRADNAALEAAMVRLMDGDGSALDRFIRRGGNIAA